MKHFIITCFKVKKKGDKLFTKSKAENPAKRGAMYFTEFPIRNKRPKDQTLHRRSLTVEKLSKAKQKVLINKIVEKVKTEPNGKKDVCIFINGNSVAKKNHKLNLLYDLHQNYVLKKKSSIGTLIFFSWPGFGIRVIAEIEEAIKIGENLNKNIDFLGELSDQLKTVNSNLHLIVQSWGNRLIAGLGNELDLQKPRFKTENGQGAIFKNIFLMAPDVPSKALSPRGIRTNNGLYKLRKLSKAAENIHVFFDKQDGILAFSKSAVEEDYDRLGTIGYLGNTPFDNFHFYDVEKIDPNLIKPSRFKFKNKRHRYFLYSKKIVETISNITKSQSVLNESEIVVHENPSSIPN